MVKIIKNSTYSIDNKWVDPYLLLKYNSHINVEICSTISAIKYLYKYVYKGHDRVMFELKNKKDNNNNNDNNNNDNQENENKIVIDEIQNCN